MKKFKNLEEAQEAFESLSKEHDAALKTIDSLNASVKEYAANAGELNSTIEDLRKQHSDAVISFETNFAERETTMREMAALIDELRKNAVATVKGSKPVFTNGGKQYQVNVKSFSLHGKVHTAQELIENEDLQDELIEMESGHISEVVEAEE